MLESRNGADNFINSTNIYYFMSNKTACVMREIKKNVSTTIKESVDLIRELPRGVITLIIMFLPVIILMIYLMLVHPSLESYQLFLSGEIIDKNGSTSIGGFLRMVFIVLGGIILEGLWIFNIATPIIECYIYPKKSVTPVNPEN